MRSVLHNDREFPMIFNGFLSVVMPSIFFSVAEAASTSKAKVQVLMLLSIVIILVNN